MGCKSTFIRSEESRRGALRRDFSLLEFLAERHSGLMFFAARISCFSFGWFANSSSRNSASAFIASSLMCLRSRRSRLFHIYFSTSFSLVSSGRVRASTSRISARYLTPRIKKTAAMMSATCWTKHVMTGIGIVVML